MYTQLPRNDYISNTSRGSQDKPNYKLCWQSHDDYYDCINNQIEKRGESKRISKILLRNQ